MISKQVPLPIGSLSGAQKGHGFFTSSGHFLFGFVRPGPYELYVQYDGKISGGSGGSEGETEEVAGPAWQLVVSRQAAGTI